MFKGLYKIVSLLAVLVICISPLFVLAQGGSGQPGGAGGSGQPIGSGNTSPSSNSFTIEFKNPFKGGGTTVPSFLKAIFDNILLPIGGVVAAMMVMYAGFLYVTAAGNPGQIEKAHKALLYAVIGSAILLGAWVIQEGIRATIDQFKL